MHVCRSSFIIVDASTERGNSNGNALGGEGPRSVLGRTRHRILTDFFMFGRFVVCELNRLKAFCAGHSGRAV
jgi:hypothetical protein